MCRRDAHDRHMQMSAVRILSPQMKRQTHTNGKWLINGTWLLLGRLAAMLICEGGGGEGVSSEWRAATVESPSSDSEPESSAVAPSPSLAELPPDTLCTRRQTPTDSKQNKTKQSNTINNRIVTTTTTTATATTTITMRSKLESGPFLLIVFVCFNFRLISFNRLDLSWVELSLILF